jgi:plasmid maintenance system antidote protein VapI
MIQRRSIAVRYVKVSTTSRLICPANLVTNGVSADTALLFEALTRWDAQIWLTLQAKWDLWHALRARGRRPRVKALPRTA